MTEQAGSAFEGQRPPFEPGNTLGEKHGGNSERRLVPLAEERYQELRQAIGEEFGWRSIYEGSARALARIRARHDLITQWLSDNGLVRDDGEVASALRELTRGEGRELQLLRDLAMTVRSRDELDVERLKAERGLVSLAEVDVLLDMVAKAADTSVRKALEQRVGEAAAREVERLFRPLFVAALGEVGRRLELEERVQGDGVEAQGS